MQHYCVIGYPVAHSLSPQIHNAAFQALGIDADFVKIELNPADLEKFMKTFREIYSGCNATIPHKETIMKFLYEIEPEAKKIGAVNTVLNKNGKLIGFNTDMYGAITGLNENIFGKRVCVIGAGGAGRAVCYGILKARGILTILNRTVSKAEKLAKEFSGFSASFGNIADFNASNFDILINTTSCGMYPKHNESPVDLKGASEKLVVMDIIYYPRKTKLIREAQAMGCKVVTGDRMFLHQGAKAFEIWTGQKAPLEKMEEVLLKALDEREAGFDK